jgi:lipoate-protein ligase A
MQPKPGFLSADYKVVGGKLLRVRLTVAESTDGTRTIDSITIFGDFFMHPEEAIEELEHALTGAALDETALTARVQTFFDSDVQIIGAGVDDFVHVILKAA